MQLLTYSRQDCFKTCRKKEWWGYEMRIRPTEDARALRMGRIYHGALELLAIPLLVSTSGKSICIAPSNSTLRTGLLSARH
jgi:hypothetical protein